MDLLKTQQDGLLKSYEDSKKSFASLEQQLVEEKQLLRNLNKEANKKSKRSIENITSDFDKNYDVVMEGQGSRSSTKSSTGDLDMEENQDLDLDSQNDILAIEQSMEKTNGLCDC